MWECESTEVVAGADGMESTECYRLPRFVPLPLPVVPPRPLPVLLPLLPGFAAFFPRDAKEGPLHGLNVRTRLSP